MTTNDDSFDKSEVKKSVDTIRIYELKHPVFTCIICDQKFVYGKNLKNHMDAHVNQKIECIVCKKFFHHDSIKSHLKTHIIKTFICDYKHKSDKICNKTFIYKFSLMSHKNSVNYKKYKCDNCKTRFSSICSYKEHFLNIHKKYVCEICVKIFTQKRYLTRHLKIHDGHKKYKCKQCNNSFIYITQLNLHMKISHSNKQMCYICYLEFDKDKFNEHLCKHGKPEIKCFDCDTTFDSLSEISNHDKNHIISIS